MKKEKFNVGGQAVLEGVMMRSPNFYSVAVRRKNKKIVIFYEKIISLAEKYKFLKWPIFRGILTLIESMKIGFKALDFSTKIYEEDYETDKKKKNKKKNDTKEKIISFLMFSISFILAIFLFVVVPWSITKFMGKKFTEVNQSRTLFNLIIVIYKMIIFLLYVWFISFFDDIKRFFQYHGAEHKSIYAYENGERLIYKNIKKYSTLHPRCGTSFIVLFILMSLVIFVIFLPPSLPLWKRLLWEIPLIIPIAGISYEILKISDRFKENPIMKIFVLPGLAFQKITTKEPDKNQIEVAVKALNKVIKLEKNLKKGKKNGKTSGRRKSKKSF